MKEKISATKGFTEFEVTDAEKEAILKSKASLKGFLVEGNVFMFETTGKVIPIFRAVASSSDIETEKV